MLDVMEDSETIVGGADGTAGFNLWLKIKKESFKSCTFGLLLVASCLPVSLACKVRMAKRKEEIR